MGHIIGLGGVFINLKGDKDKLYQWYHNHLGLDMTNYGTGFITGEQLMVVSLKREPASDSPYLNFRVDDIQSIYDDLYNQNVQFLTDIQSYDFGKFVIFIDPFGNQIELWEANPEPYRNMVKKEIETYNKSNKT